GPPQPVRVLNRLFRRRRRLALASVLSPPVFWMLFVYLGSLLLLVASAFFALDPDSQKPTTTFTTDNITDALTDSSAIRLFAQTVLIATIVTVTCVLIALPTAFFIAKIAPRWVRRGLMVSILLPLWAGYMVKTYAWRAMVSPAGGNQFAAAGRGGGGFMESVLGWTPGFSKTSVVIALVYLWLPFMVLPIYAGLERLPSSLLDAAGDLGAKPMRTFSSVIVPLLLPSIAAGSIFTYSLSLGDYILPRLVVDGKERVMFGELINSTLGAPNQPLAAAYTVWPLVMIILYLFAMKRAGAFDNL
ncbi:MAG: ABC transporter permease, partial [Ilumatobacteraceae bacterium]|nr:ABC transporter permease [Ilumatobacteraceae bacterium]